MKAIISCTLLMTFLAVQTVSAASLTTVPENVEKAFLAKYPTAQDVVWDEYNEQYVASFDLNGHYTEVTFEASGKWLESSVNISEEDLQEGVVTMIRKDFPNIEYYNTVRLLETPEHGEQTVVNFDTDTQNVTLTFSKEGALLHKEVEEY